MTPEEIREYRQQFIDRAKAGLPRAPADRSLVENQLIDSLAEIIPFDVDAERRRKAKKWIDKHKRPGETQPDGQLRLPGFNSTYDYEPNRLVSDDAGNIIENYLAPPRFKAAATARSRVNVEHAVEQLRRQSAENDVFQAWALEEALAGRPALDLTWGNCIAESNLR